MSSLNDSSLRGSPQTFPEVLVRNAELRGQCDACSFLVDGEQESEHLNYGQLYQRVQARATHLASRFQHGERVLLVYPSGTEFIVAFFACLCAGLIPVPASPPDRRRGYSGLRAIADNSGVSAILTDDSLYDRMGDTLGSAEGLGFLPLLSTSRFIEGVAGQALPVVRPTDVALLQYTSGSTGTPRGVVVTHANLIINARELAKSVGHDASTRIVSWLPMFHDMGLGSLLQGVWNAFPCVIMPARAFLQKPVRWLAAISKYRGTSSAAPNFAYDLCLRRVSRADMEGLDLSCWKVAANGSEPVNPTTIECFSAKFAPCGFQREAMRPVYGLAEATLFVSSESAGAPPVVRHFDAARLEQDQAVEVDPGEGGAHGLVSCGHTWLDATTRIVHPRTLRACGPGEVGEIWVRGPSVTQGYWLNEQATSASFGAVTSEGEGPFLRTGDTGFQDAEGRLFVTGRLKDLIIVRGRNHYPQDIELTVADCHPDLEPYAAAAFSVRADVGESLVIAQEVKRSALRRLDAADVFRQIRRAVSEQHGLQTQEILLLRPGGLPRTTSGKVQRKECEARHRRGELSVAASWAARSEMVAVSGESLFPPVSDSTRAESCRRVVEWLRARGAELALHGREPSSEQRELAAQQGLLGLQVAPDYGGLDLSEAGVVAVLEQLGALDVGLACWVANANSCGTRLLQRHGREPVQRATLPGLVASGAVAAVGQAFELGAGLEPMTGDRYRLRGKVAWHQHDSTTWVLNALVPDPECGGESMFSLQVRPAGIEIESQTGPAAVGGLLQMSASLEGIVAGGSELLGRRGAGRAVAEEARAHLFLGIAAACLGGLKRAAQLAVDFASRAPGVGGKPLLLHPVTLARLGPVTASVTSLESLVGVLARSVDRGRQLPRHAFVVCKVAGPDLLWRAADDLVQLAGERVREQASLVRSLHADARMLRLFAGATETLAGGLGEEVLEDSEPLRRFLADTCSAPHLVPSLDQALEAVRIRNRQMAQTDDAPTSHWAAARAGELATWAVLLGGLESRRRMAWSDELARASAWVRASYERSLASVQGGTPSEAIALGPAAITEAVESYAIGVGSLHPPKSPLATLAGADLSTRPPPLRGSVHDSHRLREWIVAWLARHLRMDVQQIDPDRSFADHGIDSMAAVQLAKALSDKLGQPLDETLLWNFATIGQLVEHLVNASNPEGTAPEGSGSDSDSLSVEEELEQMEQELKRR